MKKYVAIIADIKDSKKINNRKDVQENLRNTLDYINDKYESFIESKFTITLGDEFQGLLNDASVVIDIIEYINSNNNVSIRYGIGIGSILTAINKELSLGADGPAYHNARSSINQISINEKKNSIYPGSIRIKLEDNIVLETSINTILCLMCSIKDKQTQSQKRIISLMENNITQSEVATKAQVDQSTVQRALKNGCYYEYIEAKKALKLIMSDLT